VIDTLKTWAVRGARAVVLALMTVFLCSEHVSAYVSLGRNLFISNDAMGRRESGFMDNVVYSSNLTNYSGMSFCFVKSDIGGYTDKKRGDKEDFTARIQLIIISPLSNAFFSNFNIMFVSNMPSTFDCISEKAYSRASGCPKCGDIGHAAI
jgi:hypothetical protein